MKRSKNPEAGSTHLRGRALGTTLPFPDWLIERYGPGWVVAQRVRPELRRKCALIISPAEYEALEIEWEWAFYGAPLKSLRAAAADLLASVREVVDVSEGSPSVDRDARAEIVMRARAAIAKAEGR